ncbi:unnamed protein product [Ectocarpus sp. 12 AP-2014]
MVDNGNTAAAPVAPAVPARRGYTISRVEAAPTAASNRPLNVAAANGGYDKAATDKKKAPHGKGGAGRTGRGGDGGSKDGGRGKKKRAGKGGNAVSLSTGRGDTRLNNEPSGGFDRSKANAPRGSAHQQQASRGEDSGFAGVRSAATTTMRRDGGRRQYHHEHDDRAEAPPAAAAAASTRPVSFTSRRQRRDPPQSDTNIRANPSNPGTASHAKPSHVRGRGDRNSGGGGGEGGGGILSRLGSPPRSPRIGNQGRADDNTNPNVHGRAGSPPPSPRNALSRTDDNTNRKHDRRGAHRSSAATLSRASDAAKGEARLGSNDARHPLPHPPAAAIATTAKQGRKEDEKQGGRAASGANSRDGSGGSNSSFSPSSRSGGVVNNAVNNAAKSRSSRQRDDGGRGDNNPVGSRKGEDGGSRVSGGRPDAGATAVPVHRTGEKSSGSGREGCRVDRDGAQHSMLHKQRQQKQDKYARGTCMSMCPESERREREAEGGLSSFEATEASAGASVSFRQRVADPKKTVKKYRRSAAGRDMHSPELLRPLSVLQTTTQYLVQDVFAVACSSSSSVSSQRRRDRGGSPTSLIAQAYMFVEDRLRAVRQDLTVQGLALEGTTGAAEVLQTTANFYILAGYLMSDEARINVFDRHLHTRELQGVFSSLAELFFQGARVELPSQILNHHHHHHLGVDEYLCLQAVHALATAISNGNSSSGGDTQLGDAAGEQGVGRLFTTTVSKLCGGSSFSLPPPTHHSDGDGRDAGIASVAVTDPVEGRILPAPVSFRTAFPKMATAVRILAVVRDGNWSEFFRLLGNFTPRPNDDAIREGKTLLVGGENASSPFAVRLRCVCHDMLLPVRAHALRAMNKAYGKSEKVPLADVARILRARDEEHAEGICRALSLPIEEIKHGGGSNTSLHQTDAEDQPKAVVFKCVPAVWKSETAKKTGYFCGTNNGNARGCTLREDDWVGLTRALAASASDENRSGRSADSNKTTATATCTACAGFGCSWCENGIVKAEEGNPRIAQEEEEGLWEAALCPTRKTTRGCK